MKFMKYKEINLENYIWKQGINFKLRFCAVKWRYYINNAVFSCIYQNVPFDMTEWEVECAFYLKKIQKMPTKILKWFNR